VLTQLLHTLLEYTIQHTTYLLSCELLSRLLRSMCPRLSTDPPTTQTAYEPLSATSRTNTLPFLILINWTGLVVKSPCGLVSKRSFHNIQRHCYNHRSYQWSDPHGSEQACLNELLLAELCRHTSFGCVTTVILHKPASWLIGC